MWRRGLSVVLRLVVLVAPCGFFDAATSRAPVGLVKATEDLGYGEAYRGPYPSQGSAGQDVAQIVRPHVKASYPH